MKRLRLCLTLSAMLGAPGAALAQVDYSAGKSAPQLFSSDCSACHQSPGGLAKGRDASALASFLREHYTTGGASAGLLASYLAGLPAGRQPAARASQTPGTTATAPPGAAPRPPVAVEAERTKPGDARKPKPTDAEREAVKPVATQADREPAKPATVDSLSTKLRSYATIGEPATPVAAAAPEPTEPGAAPPAAESTAPASDQPSEPSQSARPPG